MDEETGAEPGVHEESRAVSRRSLARLLLRNPAIILAVAYLIVSLIGVLFALIYYSLFEINIFNYWGPSDLFLAGFRHPVAFIWTGVAFVYIACLQYLVGSRFVKRLREGRYNRLRLRIEEGRPSLLDRLDAWMARKSIEERFEQRLVTERAFRSIRDWRAQEWAASMVFFLATLVVVTMVSLDFQLRGHPPKLDRVLVVFADGTRSAGLESDSALFVLGRTNQFLILYDAGSRTPVITPWESILSLRHQPVETITPF